jgi:putative endopeptidase
MMIAYITMFMPEMLGKIYADNYFSSETKQYICNMIELIKLSAKQIINKCYWMSEYTKEKSIEKVELMAVKVGAPTEIRDYSEFVQFVDNNPIEMTLSCSIFYGKDNFLKLGTKVDRNKWSMASYVVNAYYSPLNNEIVIPAGILHEPFYDINVDLPSNLGSIGSVIAHEISHGFDDQGRMFDAYGNYNSWWKDEDVQKYKSIIKNFKEQYNSISILGNMVSGDITIGENIADFTGMVILTNILRINNSPDKDYANMYTKYAILWRQKIRDKEMIKRLKTDVHAPPRLRTNVILSNIPDFIRVFKIKPEHKMYISDVKRFKLWF